MAGFSRYEELLARLGKHKKGKSCLYVNKLADVDPAQPLKTTLAGALARSRIS